MSKRYVVGIDPGVKTGFAVWDRAERKFRSIGTTEFWSIFDFAADVSPDDVKFIVETYDWKPTFGQRRGKASSVGVVDRMARNVGQVMREARLIIEGLRRRGFEVVECAPLGKKNADQFRRLTGWQDRTNQHERDAAVMAFQM